MPIYRNIGLFIIIILIFNIMIREKFNIHLYPLHYKYKIITTESFLCCKIILFLYFYDINIQMDIINCDHILIHR